MACQLNWGGLRCRAASLIVALSATACVGNIGQDRDGEGAGPSGGSGVSGTPGGQSGKAPDPAALMASAESTPLRRLSHAEYDRTVFDLFGEAILGGERPSASFPPDASDGRGFSNEAKELLVATSLADHYLDAAERIAAAVDLSVLLPCSSTDEACASQFIQSFGKQVFRRPLQSDQVANLLEVFRQVRDGAGDANFDKGIRAALMAMLVSPHFLYRVESRLPATGQERVDLDGYEVATRLSYFLWGTMPDEQLFAAADADQLKSREQIEAQARRLLASPRADATWEEFHFEWLGLTRLPYATKDTSVYEAFDKSNLRGDMAEETRRFIRWVVRESDGNLDTLLTSPTTFVNSRLAENIYAIPGPADAKTFELVQLPAEQRAGILTQPSLMTVLAEANQTHPILRGLLVRRQLLCQELPDPPADVMPVVPDLDPNASTKDRFAQHRTDPACASCHEMIDPLGFGFEHYDAVGRYRTAEGQFAVDASGEIKGTDDIDGVFVGAPELAKKLASSQQVKDCVVQQWFRYAFAREVAEGDAATVRAVTQSFTSSNSNLVELVVDLTTSDDFRQRIVKEGSL